MHKHIIQGLSAAGTLRQYLHTPLKDFAVFDDSLVLGPLLSVQDIDEFSSAREGFWRYNSFQYDDYLKFMRFALDEFIYNLKQADSFTLWISPGAHDQIMWAWLVHLFEEYGIDWANVEVKHLFNKENSVLPYMTLGELGPKEFKISESFKIEECHTSTLYNAYEALISSTPEKLVTICDTKEYCLPELQQSLKSYLKFYPDPKTGLTVSDRVLLSNCSEKRLKSARIVGYSMMDDAYEKRLLVGDGYLFHRLIKLSQRYSKNPLVELYGDIKSNHSMRWTEISITEQGKEVLAGHKNNIELNGIDDYIGGVHLSSEKGTAQWFYDNGTVVKR